jgi:vitamin B12/bleomycin/antimicrobial peptide transport system ATP-binding/permease protein
VQQLRAALAYPFPETAFKDDELVAALQSSGLNPLSSSLNEIARWENELVLEEQQCLVLTRLLLHKPGFLVTDETLDTLEEEARKLAIKLFEEELKNTVIINIGRPETRSQLLTRLLHLIKDPNGHSFKPDLSAAFSSPA